MSNKGSKKQRYTTLLGKHIQKKRDALDMTQAQLAENADISTKHLGNIERGVREPRAFILGKIEHELDIDKKAIFKEFQAAEDERESDA